MIIQLEERVEIAYYNVEMGKETHVYYSCRGDLCLGKNRRLVADEPVEFEK